MFDVVTDGGTDGMTTLTSRIGIFSLSVGSGLSATDESTMRLTSSRPRTVAGGTSASFLLVLTAVLDGMRTELVELVELGADEELVLVVKRGVR